MARSPRLGLSVPIRALGPVSAVPLRDALRSGIGAATAILLAAVLALIFTGLEPQYALIAPFGASAVLVFGAVSSPLAQPWPVIVGNTGSALVAVTICMLVRSPYIAAALCIGCALVAMALLRATHPPGGAVALSVALGGDAILEQGYLFALLPVAAGSIFLVLCAVAWARATGRRYPMRQFRATGPTGAAGPAAAQRLGLTEAELRDLLARYRQSLNLGVEDLARLIGAAELQAASHHIEASAARDIMSKDLVTVTPQTPVETVAAIFRERQFTSLPVVSEAGAFMGVIFQLHIIDALYRRPNPWHLARLLHKPRQRLLAQDIMSPSPLTAPANASIGTLVAHLAGRGADAVMILDEGKLVGVVTQTDLIAGLARSAARKSV